MEGDLYALFEGIRVPNNKCVVKRMSVLLVDERVVRFEKASDLMKAVQRDDVGQVSESLANGMKADYVFDAPKETQPSLADVALHSNSIKTLMYLVQLGHIPRASAYVQAVQNDSRETLRYMGACGIGRFPKAALEAVIRRGDLAFCEMMCESGAETTTAVEVSIEAKEDVLFHYFVNSLNLRLSAAHMKQFRGQSRRDMVQYCQKLRGKKYI